MQQSVLRVLARIVLATIALAAVVDAQSFQGGVRGTLKDAQGIIPGATIVLLNPANGSFRELLIADLIADRESLIANWNRESLTASRRPSAFQHNERRGRVFRPAPRSSGLKTRRYASQESASYPFSIV